MSDVLLTKGPEPDDSMLIRYLVGRTSEEETERLDELSTVDEEFAQRLRAVEHDLVDAYVNGELTGDTLEGFRSQYLSSPSGLAQVEFAEALRGHQHAAMVDQASAPGAGQGWWSTFSAAVSGWPTAWMAVAAAMLLLAAGGLWIARSPSRAQPPQDVRAPESPRPGPAPSGAIAQAPPHVPVTIAVTLSAINVRGTDDAAILIIPPGTDLVALRLEGDRAVPRFERGRAVVRTLSGNEIWSGPAVADGGASPSFARVDVPADTLRPDDYIVVLFDTAANGIETERYRYFLRVRPR